MKNLQVLFVKTPEGRAKLSDFKTEEADVPELKEGEVLVENEFISVDPYLRGRFSTNVKSYAAPATLGTVVISGSLGKVLETKSDKFKVGDIVSGYGGWQKYFVGNENTLRLVNTSLGPKSSFLGVLGLTGLTAYVGFVVVGQASESHSKNEKGEKRTVLVSTAAGATGSIVGQIAKILGYHVVGITSTQKVDFVKSLGFDAVVDYKTASNLEEAIQKVTPNGVDIYFDNVGGEALAAALKLSNSKARIVLCGAISQYDKLASPDPGPNLTTVVGKEIRIEGFIVSSHASKFTEYREQLAQWIKEGKLKSEETVFEGLEKSPEAFISLFEGTNVGKVVVKV